MSVSSHPAWSPLTLPASWAFRSLVAVRNAGYDHGFGVKQPPIPVISVGNLAVGGTGKTPLVSRLVTLLRDLGARPAVVSRGYGGRAGRGPMRVTTQDPENGGAARFGDEPWMLASRFPDVPVYVGSDRWAGATAAAGDGADVAVLDDGFQHRRLRRRLDLVVLPAAAPLGNGRCLPAGPLREPVSALGRAHILVRVGSPAEPVEPIPGAPAPSIGQFHAVRRSAGFVLPDGGGAAAPERAVVFCGIGNPRSFRELVEEAGVRVEAFVSFADHHPFRERDRITLERLAAHHDAPLVTTEKDAARMEGSPEVAAIRRRILYLRMDLEISHEDALRRALGVALGKGAVR